MNFHVMWRRGEFGGPEGRLYLNCNPQKFTSLWLWNLWEQPHLKVGLCKCGQLKITSFLNSLQRLVSVKREAIPQRLRTDIKGQIHVKRKAEMAWCSYKPEHIRGPQSQQREDNRRGSPTAPGRGTCLLTSQLWPVTFQNSLLFLSI